MYILSIKLVTVTFLTNRQIMNLFWRSKWTYLERAKSFSYRTTTGRNRTAETWLLHYIGGNKIII